ncbi:DUF2829 domain-containing protein [Xenorhabdus bovienii]|uniref:DUF2829 domain-containing protein n=1 Tax=Xenorhabdus bovienii TaxID=40576 RepID=UPI0023B29247|nr:DUF2829 domain-containing protein [Xenorhabdus bovienii]MDE9431337.1 DUF2829 domain-containing protein [Xenorhabdus bovienii]MDE9489225.1 DUF2829 domain-containing protein [Xenorhabdus bovienii]MDE9505329.1 DUF2829 domain-containing protein [Xenorhabdus bovienii]MDE9547518.1 DUF2829 domain-containing protein [Xenorhabdus bovienii]
MSDVINPEHECPFDPKHYQCDCFIAPVGSFSWALIQLKLRKRVTRSVWMNCQGNNEMYLAITPRVNNLTVEKDSAYAVDGVAVGTKYDYLTHIDLRNEHGNFVPWQPTQEDMMACDWKFVEEELVKPKPTVEPAYQLKAKLTVGKSSPVDTVSEYFGYSNRSKRRDSLPVYSMGGWEEISNNTLLPKDIREFSVIHTASAPPNMFAIDVKDDPKRIKEQLGSKRLIIKFLGKEYDLGVAKTEYTLALVYTKTTDSSVLEELFVSEVGKTLEIELNFFTE